jgi:hypothetical protein
MSSVPTETPAKNGGAADVRRDGFDRHGSLHLAGTCSRAAQRQAYQNVLRVVISFQVRDVVLNSRRDQTNYLQPQAQRAQPRAISLASVASAQLRSLGLLCAPLETAWMKLADLPLCRGNATQNVKLSLF